MRRLPFVVVVASLALWPLISSAADGAVKVEGGLYFGPAARTGPVPSADSLKVLFQDFAWRRTAEGSR